MNQYTWEVAPRGKKAIVVVTYGKDHDEAQARAKTIVRDVWKSVFETNPDHEIYGDLVKVEEGTMDVIHYEPHFVGSDPAAKAIAQAIAQEIADIAGRVRSHG